MNRNEWDCFKLKEPVQSFIIHMINCYLRSNHFSVLIPRILRFTMFICTISKCKRRVVGQLPCISVKFLARIQTENEMRMIEGYRNETDTIAVSRYIIHI